MDRIGRQQSHRGEVEILEDLQLFEQHEAGRIGRRFEYSKAVVIDADRLLDPCLEGREIASRDQGPCDLQSRGKPPGDRTAVEALGTLGSQLLERAGEVRLDNRGAER